MCESRLERAQGRVQGGVKECHEFGGRERGRIEEDRAMMSGEDWEREVKPFDLSDKTYNSEKKKVEKKPILSRNMHATALATAVFNPCIS
mmetsp:Transcript_24564/g.48205  ORF Transcript_24564/g.48205 Transcript_24564/m.48205 type:complete len:90 (+) Transcript_24564:344-613(+)